MLTVVADIGNSNKVVIPADEMRKLGITDGDEVEISKNEADEIVLRFKGNQRTHQVLAKTREIIERRRSALIELGKGHE